MVGVSPKAHGPPWGGEIHSREAVAGGVSVNISPSSLEYGPTPGWPTRCSGTIRGSRRNSLGRTRFFYSQSVWMIVACKLIILFLYSYMLLFKHACVFFEVPRIEEVQDPSNSPRREEVGRRTLRDYGGLLLPFFYRARFRE